MHGEQRKRQGERGAQHQMRQIPDRPEGDRQRRGGCGDGVAQDRAQMPRQRLPQAAEPAAQARRGDAGDRAGNQMDGDGQRQRDQGMDDGRIARQQRQEFRQARRHPRAARKRASPASRSAMRSSASSSPIWRRTTGPSACHAVAVR